MLKDNTDETILQTYVICGILWHIVKVVDRYLGARFSSEIQNFSTMFWLQNARYPLDVHVSDVRIQASRIRIWIRIQAPWIRIHPIFH